MATSDNWGQGSKNNDNGWGKGASNNSNGWGAIHAGSYGHPTTNLTGEGGFVGLLDLYPNAAFATGMRLLRADYTGGILRIIAYDGASQQGAADIMPYKIGNEYWVSFNSKLENLDATATARGLTTNDTLADLCSVGVNNYDGLVPSWYDQSLNANHATQTNISNMPKLVDAGVLNTRNGKPIINNVTRGRLINESLSTSGDFTTFIVGQSEVTDRQAFADSFNSIANLIGRWLSSQYTYQTVSEPLPPSDNKALQLTALKSSTSILRTNGNQSASGTGPGIYDGLSLFDPRGNPDPIAPNYPLEGGLQEVIIYDQNMSSNFAVIEPNQINALNIQV